MTAPIRPQRGDDDRARIERNLDRMRRARASREELAAYLQSEGIDTGALDMVAAPAASRTLPGFGSESTAFTGRTKEEAAARSGDYNLAAQMARSAGQGVAMGFEDELEAAGRAPFSERTYPEIRDELRAKEAAFRKDYPVTALASEGVGAIGSGLALGGAGLLKGGASAGASLGRRAVGGMIAGGAQGAVTGIGSANGDIGDRIRGGVVGGIAGGVLGGVIPVGVEAVRAGSRYFRPPTGQAAARVANEKLAEALARDRLTPTPARGQTSPSVLDRVDELGDSPISRPVTLMDAGADNVRGLARAAQTTPGEGRRVIGDFLDARDAGQAQRLAGNFSARSKVNRENLVQLAQALEAAKTQDAEQYFAAAFRKAEAGIDDDELFALLQDYPSFRESWPKAVKLMREAEGNRAFAARTRGVGQFPGETLEEQVAKKNARGLYVSAREPNGGFRRADAVSDEGIVDELKSLYGRRDARMTDTNYETVIDDYGNARQVSRSTEAVTSQGKARENIRDWDRIIANYEEELKKRGWNETRIANALWGEASGDLESALEREAMRAQDAGTAAGVDDWLFDPTAQVPDAPAKPRRLPTGRELHFLKIAQDERIEGAAGANPLTNTSAGNTSAHYMSQTRDKLVDRMNRHMPSAPNDPGYETATSAFAKRSQGREALALGEAAWGKNPDVIKAEMAALDPEARDLYRRSLANAVLRDIRQHSTSPDVGRAVFGSRGRVAGTEDILEQVRAAMPDETQYRLFVRDLEAEAALAEASRDVGRGSRTAPTLNEGADLANHPVARVGRQLAQGRPGSAVMSGLFSGLAQRAQGFSEDVGRELAQRLTATPGTDPEAFTALLYALERAKLRRVGAVRGERAVSGFLGNRAGATQRP